jgi:hypothetical protein
MIRLDILSALALSIGAIAPGAHAQQAAASPGTGAQDILAGVQVVVAADGSVASVVPDAALPEPIRAGLVKRVSRWHYKAPMWQGQPVSISMRQGLRLQAVPTTSGGYALRVVGEAYVPDPDPKYVLQWPDYPTSLRRKKIEGALTYAIHVGADGRATDVRRRYPEGSLDAAGQALDESARAAIALSSWHPFLANGTPVECDLLYPVVFMMKDGAPPPAESHSESLATGLQLCPKAALETKIEGTLL